MAKMRRILYWMLRLEQESDMTTMRQCMFFGIISTFVENMEGSEQRSR